jgi:hypothetical protein
VNGIRPARLGALGVSLLALAAALPLGRAAGPAPAAETNGRLDVEVRLEGQSRAAAVLCIVEPTGRTHCHGEDRVLAGPVAEAASLCAVADRRLEPPCANDGRCRFRHALPPEGSFGLVLLDSRPPAFGVPRNRRLDVAVVANDDAGGTQEALQLGRTVRALTRCLAPSAAGRPDATAAPIVTRASCESGPCRLEHSTLQFTARRTP